MRFSQSRSRRYILDLNFKCKYENLFLVHHVVKIQPKGDDSDHDRHSSSRSKSRKKSSKSTRSPKRRSRFILILI